MNMVQDVGDIP